MYIYKLSTIEIISERESKNNTCGHISSVSLSLSLSLSLSPLTPSLKEGPPTVIIFLCPYRIASIPCSLHEHRDYLIGAESTGQVGQRRLTLVKHMVDHQDLEISKAWQNNSACVP